MKPEVKRAVLELCGKAHQPFRTLSDAAAPSQKLMECLHADEMSEDVPVCANSVSPEKDKAKKYADAEANMAKIKIARARALSIVKGIYAEVEKEFPKASVLKKLALAKKALNGVNLYDAFNRFAEELGYIDPGQLGIYERKED
jgi:hypothetical protein